MKKKLACIIVVQLLLVFNLTLAAQENSLGDDPFAGMDMGAGAGDDPFAGMDMGAGAGDDPFAGTETGAGASDDPFAGMDMDAGAGDDPFAGMDMGAGAGDDPFAGMDMGAGAGDDLFAGTETGAGASDDPFAGMDMGAGAGDDPFAGTETGAGASDDPFAGMDMGAGAGDDPFAGMGSGDDIFGDRVTDTAQAASPLSPTARAATVPRKTGPVEIYTVAEARGFYRTNEVRSSRGYLGDFPSLKDYIDYRMQASSYLDEGHNPENMADVRADSAWVERNITGGRGESVTIDFVIGSFSGVYEEYMKKATIKEIKFLNGDCRSRENWENSYRPMRMRLLLNNKVIAYINMRDTMNWQTAKFATPVTVREGDVLKAEFVEVFPAVRREDDRRVAITEIALIGDYQ